MRKITSTKPSHRTRRMGVGVLAIVTSAVLALAGCTPAAEEEAAEGGVTAEVIASAMARSTPWVITSSGPGVVVDGKSLDFTVIKIATVRAAEQMKEQGWNVEARFIEANENVIQSALQGESDVINIALPSVLAAVTGGVPVKIFAGGSKFGFIVVGDTAIGGPEDLDGKRVAYQAPISAGTLAVRLWALGVDVEPQYLTMAGSAARAEALIAGQLDAVAVSTGFDQTIIDQGQPGQFAALYEPLEEYPFLMDTVLAYVGEVDLEKRAFLQTFMVEQIKAVEELTANPAILEEWMAFHEVTVAPPVDVLIGLLFSDVGISADTINEQISLMVETEQLEGGATPEGADLIDSSIWDAITAQ